MHLTAPIPHTSTCLDWEDCYPPRRGLSLCGSGFVFPLRVTGLQGEALLHLTT